MNIATKILESVYDEFHDIGIPNPIPAESSDASQIVFVDSDTGECYEVLITLALMD